MNFNYFYFVFGILLVVGVSSAPPKAASSENATGHYVLESSKNFSELLKELGVNYLIRVAASAAKAEVEVTKNAPNSYTVEFISTFGNHKVAFKDGERLTQHRADGVDVPTVFQVRGNKWMQTQFGKPEVKIVWDFRKNSLKLTSTANGVTSVRVYRKQK